MTPWGWIPVTIQLQDQQYKDDILIYPGILGALNSWKAAKGLGILLLHYLCPQPRFTVIQLTVKATTDNRQQCTINRIMQGFPTIFDRQVRMMEVAEFHVLLAEGAVPFCAKHSNQYHLHTERS